jgi:DNA-directed RNA polymerase subunit omega
MLVKPTMESLLKKVTSRYVLTILAAKRARQLVDGAQPMAKSETPNFVTTACEEIAAGKVLPIKGIHTVHVPLRPEVEADRLREEIEKRNARYREDMEEESNARIRSLIAVVGSDDESEDMEDLAEEDLVIDAEDLEIDPQDLDPLDADEDDLLPAGGEGADELLSLDGMDVMGEDDELEDDFTTMKFQSSDGGDNADDVKDKASKRRKTK